jgi:hypothetical protein
MFISFNELSRASIAHLTPERERISRREHIKPRTKLKFLKFEPLQLKNLHESSIHVVSGLTEPLLPAKKGLFRLASHDIGHQIRDSALNIACICGRVSSWLFIRLQSHAAASVNCWRNRRTS